MADQIRAIPDIALDMDPAVKSVLEAVKENLEIREGMRGSESSNLQDKAAVDAAVAAIDPTSFAGHILQVVTIRDATQTTYTALNSGDGTQITQLDLDITPKAQGSKIILLWFVFCEASENTMFVVHKDGSIMADSYNDTQGNNAWSGLAVLNYDNNVSTTPFLIPMMMIDTLDNSKDAVNYALAIRSSHTGTNNTFYYNRAQLNAGQSYTEASVSWGLALEVAAEA